jgi:hypothetical protein
MQNLDLDRLSDRELVNSLHAVHAKENAAFAEFLAVLGACDRRKVFGSMHEGSAYEYLIQRMGLSQDQAYRRVHVARVAREYPVVLEMIARGEITPTNVHLLEHYLTADNHHELLREAAGKTKEQVKELIAKRVLPPGTKRPDKLWFYASKELEEKIAYATSLMRHANPSGDLGAVVERAVDLLIVKLEKETIKKGKARRETTERDGALCSFVDADGVVCGSRDFLELDHADAKALGGSDDSRNRRWRCRSHNHEEAVRVFGREHMEKKVPRQRGDDLMWTNVEKALAGMGFRTNDAREAVALVRERHLDRSPPPISDLLKESIAVLA